MLMKEFLARGDVAVRGHWSWPLSLTLGKPDKEDRTDTERENDLLCMAHNAAPFDVSDQRSSV
jgi:hypothetical protein